MRREARFDRMMQKADACWLWARRGFAALLALFLSGETAVSYSQVALDRKFGTGGALNGPNYSITSEMGAVRGNNLFHSFQQFDLKARDVASFSGPANIQIQNILTRVTGGAPSSIDGTIRPGHPRAVGCRTGAPHSLHQAGKSGEKGSRQEEGDDVLVSVHQHRPACARTSA